MYIIFKWCTQMRILLIATFVPNEFQLFNNILIYFLAELRPIGCILFILEVELHCAITEDKYTIYGIFIKFNLIWQFYFLIIAQLPFGIIYHKRVGFIAPSKSKYATNKCHKPFIVGEHFFVFLCYVHSIL